MRKTRKRARFEGGNIDQKLINPLEGGWGADGEEIAYAE